MVGIGITSLRIALEQRQLNIATKRPNSENLVFQKQQIGALTHDYLGITYESFVIGIHGENDDVRIP